MADIPTNEPLTLRCGATWKWRREDLASDYPASSWTLKYWFKKTGSTAANFSITASADGNNFAVTHAAATTSGYTAGDYTWVAQVSGGSSEVYDVDSGTATLLPRYDQAANLDDRSHARKMLALVEAALEAFSLGVKEYTIGSRSMTKQDLPELLALRGRYKAEVNAEIAAERLANGLGIARTVQVRF